MYEQLKDIYTRLDRLICDSKNNSCKDCHYCCTFGTTHGVSQIEYAYITNRLKQKKLINKIIHFKDYINKKSDSQGNIVYKVCPFYDFSIMGCSIYELRPYSCRIFGPFASIIPPEFCIFREKTTIYNSKEFYFKVPMSNEIFEIKTLYEIEQATSGEMKSKKYYTMALHKYYRGNIKESKYYLEQALFENPENSQAYYQLGLWYHKTNNFEESLKNIKTALEFEPDNIEIRNHSGLFLLEKKDYLQAESEFLHVLNFAPLNTMALSGLAQIYLISGNLTRAEEYCIKAIENNSDSEIIHLILEKIRLLKSDKRANT